MVRSINDFKKSKKEENSNVDNKKELNQDIDAGSKTLELGIDEFLRVQYESALKKFKHAAEKGCARAYYFVGLMYIEGLGDTEGLGLVNGYKEAIKQWGEGKEKGDDLCEICLLDKKDFNDKYDNKRRKEARDVLEKQKENSYFFGFQLVRLCNKFGCSLLDYDQEKTILEESAKIRNGLAKYELFKFYVKNEEISKAFKYLEEAAASSQYPKALIKMGNIYENGEYGKQVNIEGALDYYQRASDYGSEQADLFLGMLYYKNQEYPKAFAPMKRAARVGEATAEMGRIDILTDELVDEKDYIAAMYYLGLMFKNGWGTDVDTEEGESWIQKAKNNGFEESEEQQIVQPGITKQKDLIRDVISKYVSFIEERRFKGASQRDTAAEVVEKIVGIKNIDYWKFCSPRGVINQKAVAKANNNYAGLKNRPPEVLAILEDESRSALRGKNGLMITLNRLITSQGWEVLLKDITDVIFEDNIMKVICEDGTDHMFQWKDSFKNTDTIRTLVLTFVFIAKAFEKHV